MIFVGVKVTVALYTPVVNAALVGVTVTVGDMLASPTGGEILSQLVPLE